MHDLNFIIKSEHESVWTNFVIILKFQSEKVIL